MSLFRVQFYRVNIVIVIIKFVVIKPITRADVYISLNLEAARQINLFTHKLVAASVGCNYKYALILIRQYIHTDTRNNGFSLCNFFISFRLNNFKQKPNTINEFEIKKKCKKEIQN